MANKTPVIALLVVPIVALGLLIFFGVKFHATPVMWTVCTIGYMLGDGLEGWQLRKDGDTTLTPYGLQLIAPFALAIWANLS